MSCRICFDSILNLILKQKQLLWCYFKVSLKSPHCSGYIVYMGKENPEVERHSAVMDLSLPCGYSQNKTWSYKCINNCCPTILEFIHEKVRNSTNDGVQPFIHLFIFYSYCLALGDYFAFGLKSRYPVLTLVTSPEANTHVEV